MSPNDRNLRQYRTMGRRYFLRGTGTATALGGLGIGTVTATPDEKQTPTPYPKNSPQGSSFESDAYFTHISELPAVQQQLDAYERSGKPGRLFTHDLARKLEEGASGTIDVTVSTCGQRSEITSRGQFGRRLHGWRPTTEEVAELEQYGEVKRVPKVISTKVFLRNVAVEDLSKIAALDFVLEIGYNPTISLQSRPERGVSTQTNPSADDLKSTSHSAFDSTVYDLTIYTQVGIIGTGYTDTTDWSKKWAESIGIDNGKAKDFVSNDWQSGNTHGTNCADTVAYMLKDGDPESNLIVPLKVLDEEENEIPSTAFADAIEYALTNDIPICSTSIETHANEPSCPSTLCSELESYCSAGYMITCATGNDGRESEVCHPATSYYTIGVGGYSGSCSGGYQRESGTYGSNYGTIDYYNDVLNQPYCSWCSSAIGQSAFKPDVYSCYRYETDAGETWDGTSASAPIVSAAGAIHHSIHSVTGYATHRGKYHGMNTNGVCPTQSSLQGEVLHVPDLS